MMDGCDANSFQLNNPSNSIDSNSLTPQSCRGQSGIDSSSWRLRCGSHQRRFANTLHPHSQTYVAQDLEHSRISDPISNDIGQVLTHPGGQVQPKATITDRLECKAQIDNNQEHYTQLHQPAMQDSSGDQNPIFRTRNKSPKRAAGVVAHKLRVQSQVLRRCLCATDTNHIADRRCSGTKQSSLIQSNSSVRAMRSPLASTEPNVLQPSSTFGRSAETCGAAPSSLSLGIPHA